MFRNAPHGLIQANTMASAGKTIIAYLIILAIEALHGTVRQEDVTYAAGATQGWFLAMVPTDGGYAQLIVKLAEPQSPGAIYPALVTTHPAMGKVGCWRYGLYSLELHTLVPYPIRSIGVSRRALMATTCS